MSTRTISTRRSSAAAAASSTSSSSKEVSSTISTAIAKKPTASKISKKSSLVLEKTRKKKQATKAVTIEDDGGGREEDKPAHCPVVGCKGEGHISGNFPRHTYKEFCPIYHGLTNDQTRQYRKRRLDTLKIHDQLPQPRRESECAAASSSSSSSTVDHRQPKHQSMTLRTIDEERKKLENAAHVRKRRRTTSDAGGYVAGGSGNSSSSSLLANIDPSAAISGEEGGNVGENNAPPIDQYVSQFDLDLFRMAQSSLAEDMESNENLRNTHSTRIRKLRFGRYEIDAWHPSQYPGEYGRLEKLFVCEFCLKYMRSEYQLRRHQLPNHCSMAHPPGEKIYVEGNLTVWEVNGETERVYCQNLCLLAMLFLDHKTLFRDVEGFYFYVLTRVDEKSRNVHHVMAYFSKEKVSSSNIHNNLSCILTLPPFLRMGYGNFLIDLSYLLSRIEGKFGTPEHPLSDLGLRAYRTYWRSKLFDWIAGLDAKETMNIKDMSRHTGIHQNDLVSTLQYLCMVKYWRGQYWVIRTLAITAHENAQRKRQQQMQQRKKSIVERSILQYAPLKANERSLCWDRMKDEQGQGLSQKNGRRG